MDHIDRVNASLAAALATIDQLNELLAVADYEVTDCWSALLFDWDTMPENSRREARDVVRTSLHGLSVRLSSQLRFLERGTLATFVGNHQETQRIISALRAENERLREAHTLEQRLALSLRDQLLAQKGPDVP